MTQKMLIATFSVFLTLASFLSTLILMVHQFSKATPCNPWDMYNVIVPPGQFWTHKTCDIPQRASVAQLGKDAFVQLVVSTYKDSARLVSNVGEHSAIFALLGRKGRPWDFGVAAEGVISNTGVFRFTEFHTSLFSPRL